MTYRVILSTYAASRATDIQQFRDQDGFVAVGSTSSRPVYSDHFPDDFKAEFDAQTAREFDTTIR